jgi:hypothetical protein
MALGLAAFAPLNNLLFEFGKWHLVIAIQMVLQIFALSALLLMSDTLKPHFSYIIEKQRLMQEEQAQDLEAFDLLKTPNYNEYEDDDAMRGVLSNSSYNVS